jgi:hypothetical protein
MVSATSGLRSYLLLACYITCDGFRDRWLAWAYPPALHAASEVEGGARYSGTYHITLIGAYNMRESTTGYRYEYIEQ